VIIYKKKFISIMEAWFGEEPASAEVDLIRCFQRAAPVSGALCREFHTILIDLSRGPDELLAGMRKNNRYEIRRALAADGLAHEFANARAPGVGEFCRVYDEFAAAKSLPRLDRAWLSLMADTGGLYITRAGEAAGDALTWHAYYLSGSRATLLYSVSPLDGGDRSRLGRVNRFHHWQDMLRLKDAGVLTYDFGGWYAGAGNRRRLNINRFKEQFGGAVSKSYICERALTLKGKLFLRARRALLGDAI
jgi:hypothetical protein